MRIKTILTNIAVLVVSSAVALVLSEGFVRLFLNPADFLMVRPVPDDILGARIVPRSAGFDEWGFRNQRVPTNVDMVAIGDSHTYGNNAKMEDSWPYVAGRSTGLRVYNLALGGYGPNQYYYLLKTKALRLKPRWILCGVWLGDDLENAFLITYGKDYWSFLRNGEWTQTDSDIWHSDVWQPEEYPRSFEDLRIWLSKNSMVYQLVFHGPILGRLKGAWQVREAARGEDPLRTALTVPEANIQEAFRPVRYSKNLDQHDPSIREGMRITLHLLKEMYKVSRENGAQFVVVLIPTKESVFAPYLLGHSEIHLSEVIDKLITEEQIARNELVDLFKRDGIPYIDTLPALRREVGNQLYYRGSSDMHPIKNGYAVIGNEVAAFLKEFRGATIR